MACEVWIGLWMMSASDMTTVDPYDVTVPARLSDSRAGECIENCGDI